MFESTTCQVMRVFLSREIELTRLRTSSGSLSQSDTALPLFEVLLGGRRRSLLIKTGARPLARNKIAKLVASALFDSTNAPAQLPVFWSCWRTSNSPPWRYQSFRPKNRRPASRPVRSSA